MKFLKVVFPPIAAAVLSVFGSKLSEIYSNNPFMGGGL